jgi:uncharacterized protein (TIGR01777 family)
MTINPINHSSSTTPRRIAITGASGLVGTRLVERLEERGDVVLRLVRSQPSAPNEIHWNPAGGTIDKEALEGLDAVVHLAGASIAGGLWTEKRKRMIRLSRVDGTALLSQALTTLKQPPQVLVSTSAIGYYGEGGQQVITEASPSGDDFLAEVCRAWEQAASPAKQSGIRVVHPRLGLVLDGEGGILPLMSIPFKLGMGGEIGSGDQYMSWIMLDDLVDLLIHSIENENLSGPVNAVAPDPVTNREFTKAMGRALKRPTFMKVPAFAARTVGGQLVEQLILVSQRVVPAEIQDTGFTFRYPTIDAALQAAFGDKRRAPGTAAAPRKAMEPVTGA